MAKNVDKNQVFEFLRVASLDNQNLEARKDAYWIVVYIFLKKNLGIDISESLVETKATTNSDSCTKGSPKLALMLKDVDVRMFSFSQGFLECNGKKVSGIIIRLIDLDRPWKLCPNRQTANGRERGVLHREQHAQLDERGQK